MNKIIPVVVLVLVLLICQSYGNDQVPCLYIFGDSLSDSGNNNNLATLAKANFLPYGIDFPGGPTGRFTNGRTTIDIIGDLLGLESYIPPYSSVDESQMLKGVNYASGSAGIRFETGAQVGMRISMDEQLRNHATVVSKISTMLRGNSSATLLNKCLYSVYIGSNDWMFNYYGGGSTIRRYTPQAFADALITQFSQQLTRMYELGARKVIVFGLGPLGCLPLLAPFGRCSTLTNNILEMYNTKLRSLVDTFNGKYNDAKFIWINTIGIVSNTLQGLGLRVTSIPCCGAFQIGCLPLSMPCLNRGQYAYWDNAHPTEAANRVLANRAFNAQQPTDTYPMDVSHLAQL